MGAYKLSMEEERSMRGLKQLRSDSKECKTSREKKREKETLDGGGFRWIA